MDGYNKTQLNPESTFERHVFHRDQFAHYLRWTHVLKRADLHMKVLDFGCGSGNLYEVFYRNRFAPARYLGLDIRPQTIKKNQEKFPKAEFQVADLTGDLNLGTDWDIITSFEVAEHVGKQRVPAFLENIKKHCNPNTLILLSTPCYDPKVGAAENHTYDSGDGNGVQPQELTFGELSGLLLERFDIVNVWGTFASQKDYIHLLSEPQRQLFDQLSRYYDSNLVSIMMAPLFPAQARNCLWELKLKQPV